MCKIVFLEMPILQLIDYHLLQPFDWLRLVYVTQFLTSDVHFILNLTSAI